MVFIKTAGFHHESIATAVPALLKMGVENNFTADTTSDASWFQQDSLQHYAAVVFLNTTGNLLNNYQQAAFERYIQAGGGYAGVHAATDAAYDWGWYGRLAGGYFNGHPAQQEAALHVVDSTHSSTKGLPALWKRKDEWYNFKKLNKEVHVLLTIDEKSYEGGTNGDFHPMAWYHEYDGGRAWYTELGHTDESYTDSFYLKHLLGGIRYSIGENKKLDYSKAVSLTVPEEDRFVKTPLVKATFSEPTEMTILPNLDILVAQHRGEIMLYKQATKTVTQAGFLKVYCTNKSSQNVEEGLLGIQADPDFKTNHFVYVFYSPLDTSVNRLSRFTFTGDKLDMASEKIILQFYSQREICCHTGGSIAFGNDNMLFLSAGDNTNPFDEPKTPYPSAAFGPMDDRPGHEQYDARRSAGNTNDLRGKIMRIKIKADETYEIPEGNLFSKNEPKARPEIYVMGNRNPYRITVDKTTNFLYWGEVGPDASNDLPERGSRGYDEINQARKAGFFGWPYFVGNNYPYRLHNYATGTNGAAFDPAKAVNESRNNTGLRDLPPANPSFIWYPYAESPDFPQMGSGGRCAMAGPVYHAASYPEATRLPAYFDGKLFIYDWTRGFFKLVTMQPNGDFDKMEPFMEHTKFNAPCDAEIGPDGKLYILEYGNGWYTKNTDAGLFQIDFNGGNRPPQIESFSTDKTSGGLPLKVAANLKATDPENSLLNYHWDFGDGTSAAGPSSVNHVYTKAGEYGITVTVSDDKKSTIQSDVLNLYAGNEAPEVDIQVKGNSTFYFQGTPVNYAVKITDRDDTAAIKDFNNLVITANYKHGFDEAQIGNRLSSPIILGKNIMLSGDCKTCHKIDEKSVGPAYTLVAKRYAKVPDAAAYLSQKIRNGGKGVWGDVPMPAHPSLKDDDLNNLVAWIQSLAQNKNPSLLVAGLLNATLNQPFSADASLVIAATYTDKGGQGTRPLTGYHVKALRSNFFWFDEIADTEGYAKFTIKKNGYLAVPENRHWCIIKDVNLTGITKISFAAQWEQGPVAPYLFEVRLDSPEGQKIGTYSFKGVLATDKITDKPFQQIINIAVSEVKDVKLHSIYFVTKADAPAKERLGLWNLQFLLK